jgi:FkbM family methyltransferase
MLREIRKNHALNSFIRKILKSVKLKGDKLSNYLINRWPTSGVIDCKFNDIHFKMYNECDDGLVNVFYYQMDYHEQHDLKLFTGLSKHAKTIIDIGANTGLYSVLSAIENPKANIYAIEPYSANFKRLGLNININNCKNILSEQIAFGDSNGTIEFTVPANNSVTDVSSANEAFTKIFYPTVTWKKETVNIETIDDFKFRKNVLEIDLIKCDVESFEMNVFRGMDSILKNDRPTIIFECFLDDVRKDFFNDILKRYDYFVYLISQYGIIHLSQGFDKNNTGLNYLISPVIPEKSFLSMDEIIANPQRILLRIP